MLVGGQDSAEEQLQGRGADAALVQKGFLQPLRVPAQLVLRRPLDAGENQRPEQQVDDVEEHEAAEQQPRLTGGGHGGASADPL